MTDKTQTDAKHVLNQLRDLSSYLAASDAIGDIESCFEKPFGIMQNAMSFDVSVLYKITNAVEDSLMLRIIRVSDPKGLRPDLFEGKRLQLSLKNPDPIFINEVLAFKTRTVSSINVPDAGCDIMGFVYLPETFGNGYLFGGDFVGKEARVKDYEASVCEIMCNFLSTILIKAQFEHLAVNDGLTGLFNSRKIKEEADRVCSRLGRKTGSHATLALCDIDHFKRVNDTWGHLQGDMILKEVGLILKSSMRAHFDLAGRYGGEEFLVVFDESCIKDCFGIVERIRKKIAAHKFTRIDGAGAPVAGAHISITMSFGLGENPDFSGVLARDEWVSRADQALYEAKKGGRNQTRIWESPEGPV